MQIHALQVLATLVGPDQLICECLANAFQILSAVVDRFALERFNQVLDGSVAPQAIDLSLFLAGDQFTIVVTDPLVQIFALPFRPVGQPLCDCRQIFDKKKPLRPALR